MCAQIAQMSPAARYAITFVAGVSSLLAGATVVHEIYKPSMVIDVTEAKRRKSA